MKNTFYSAAIPGLTVFLVIGVLSCSNPQEESALQVSESWLVLVDNGKYLESWEILAGLFKDSITQEEWINDLNRSRKPLGRLLERRLTNTQQAESDPDSPVGDYLIFQYESSFENKKPAVETVSVIKDPDGKLRILGYSVM